jgi:branched-chain amino acid transport system permease protein/neutral amino acid transport system permease protein
VSTFVAAVGFGIASGAVIALASLGFTLQFGLSNTLNIGYGGFITLAAFLGYGLIQLGLGPWPAMAVIAVVMGVLSVLYYQLFVRRLILRSVGLGPIAIATAAALIFIDYAIVAVAGTDVKSYGITSGRTLHLWDFVLSSTQVAIIALALALMLAFQMLLRFTQLGKALRATAVNRTLARSCGIRAERITSLAWLISGVLCGIAGIALAMTTQAFDFSLGSTFLILIIAAAVVGGIGEPYGAIAGGFLIGITTEVSAAYWSPAYSEVIAFALLIIVLLVRPTGILGGQARRRNVAT